MKILYASAYGTGVPVISSPSSGSLHGLGYGRALPLSGIRRMGRPKENMKAFGLP